MRSIAILFASLFLLLGNSARSFAQQELVIENFTPPKFDDDTKPDTFVPGVFPEAWKYRDKKAESIYGVMKEGNPEKYFLKAKTTGTGIQTLKKFSVDLKEYPVLEWNWRLIKFPAEGKITDQLNADNGASVYVIFSGFLSRTALKYIWSSYYTKVSDVPAKVQLKTIALRDKSDPKNVWFPEARNIREDYMKYYGKEPPKVIAIAVMTDADDTESYAEADYADFRMTKTMPSVSEPPKPFESIPKSTSKK